MYKIANGAYEAYEAEGNGGGFLVKPYEPNGVVKNDIEPISRKRKRGYRSPTLAARLLSVISTEHHRSGFQQIWTAVTGASLRHHPAPLPSTKPFRNAPAHGAMRNYANAWCVNGSTKRLASFRSSAKDGLNGQCAEPQGELGIRNFAVSLAARAAAFAQLRR